MYESAQLSWNVVKMPSQTFSHTHSSPDVHYDGEHDKLFAWEMVSMFNFSSKLWDTFGEEFRTTDLIKGILSLQWKQETYLHLFWL